MEEEQGDDETKNSISWWAVPKQVTLPKTTSFMAKYERMSRKNLPGNIRVTRTRTNGPRKRRVRKKRGWGLHLQIHLHKTELEQ